MHQRYSIFEKLGFSEKEVTVYEALLSLGASSVRTIAGQTGINRGTTYDILKALRDKGLVSYFHKEKHQYFVAEDPAQLQTILVDRRHALEEVDGEMQTVIPELRSLYQNAGGKPVVRFYEGKDGVRTILEDVLATMQAGAPREYYVYSTPTVSTNLYDRFADYSARRIAAGIAVKTISLGTGGALAGLDERRWLPVEGARLTYTVIYRGKCAFIARDAHNNLVGVIVENEDIFETQKLLFLHLWNMLPHKTQTETRQ